jgi:hypothetical protein
VKEEKNMPRISEQDARNLLANVPEEYVFRCCNGTVFYNMSDLGNALSNMSEETFAFHSNLTKHDFSNWVRDVIKDSKLARDLYKAATRSQASKSVAARITFLQGKLPQLV